MGGRGLGEEGVNGIVGVKFAVAGLAIETMKFEMLVELGKADEAFKRGRAHLGDVFEFHVVGDECFDLVDVVVGEAEAAGEDISHADADVDVAVKADAVAGFRGRAKGGGFADIVQKDAPGKSGRDASGKAFEHEEGVDPDVTFRMKLRWLLNTLQSGDFRQEFGEKAEFVEEFEAAAGGAFGE